MYIFFRTNTIYCIEHTFFLLRLKIKPVFCTFLTNKKSVFKALYSDIIDYGKIHFSFLFCTLQGVVPV